MTTFVSLKEEPALGFDDDVAMLRELPVGGQQTERFASGLGDQHSVEAVAVQ